MGAYLLTKQIRGRAAVLMTVLAVAIPGFGPAASASREAMPYQGHFGVLLTLEESVIRALKDHEEVKRALARLQKEESLYKGKLAEFLPRLGAELLAGVATGERKFLTYMDTGIEQPLFRGGKTVAEKKMQQTVVDRERLSVEEARLEVELMVRILYIQVLQEKELTRITQGQVKDLSLEHERIASLKDKEILPRAEFFRMEALFESAKHALVKHKETYDYLHSVLREAVGIEDGESLDLEPLGDIPVLHDDVAVYLSSARNHDPIYKSSELRVQEKRFEKRALQAERLPHVSLSGRWNRFQDVFADVDRFVVGIEGKWNIWDFGRLGSTIQAKEHEIEEIEWEGRIRTREREREIRRLFHDARALRQKIRMQEALRREREEIYKNERSRLIAGHRGTGELVDSFLALEEAKIAQIQAFSDYRIQMAQLDRKTAFRGPDSEYGDEEFSQW